MENTKDSCGGEKPIQENPNPDPDLKTESNPSSHQPSRTPFTSLSQFDADLALARTLQEQERAYMMLRMNGGDGGEYESSDGGSFVYEDEEVDPDDVENGESDGGEDAFDVNARADGEEELGARARARFGREAFDSDEAYARALQDAEEREVAVHLMALAGIHDWEGEDPEDYDSNSQDTWQEVDPDELSYEELLALGEVVGTESRGLSTDIIASLPSINYKAHSALDGNSDQCVICRLDYEDGDALIVLKCKHAYHSVCVNNWLQINKVCPICSAEVSASEEREGTSENARG
ncbi:E3 ubiquitin ligase BIG BROTHER-related [Cinnamomum micranthum f. kanehirae]|uniref:E3 ubiquitin ligase BIG BROTHER-related n=1 Tax=Cinnamomum micranthum f. kanehirae TaxID=337451 RepID=A0A443PNE2_9MAGN|nr:E3 ubiquitin ligase BIG BROTHER-related [Cinnamomum micranthum f. kanehirae]